MKGAKAYRRSGLSGLVLAAALACAGCKDKNSGTEATGRPSEKLTTTLQSEINRTRDLQPDPEASRRPLLTSEQAGNRPAWTLRALQQGYASHGSSNELEKATIQSAFTNYAILTSGDVSALPKLQADLKAVPVNCLDPMFQYMRLRYLAPQAATYAQTNATEFLRAHELLLRSAYHPAFKFVAGARAIAAARIAGPSSDLSQRLVLTRSSLEDLARDTNAPPELVFDMTELWLQQSQSSQWFDFVLQNLSTIVERNFGKEERWFRLRGWLEVERAWLSRGTGFARTVTAEGWRLFNEHLQAAEKFLTQAWQLDPSQPETAYLMMRVELGQGQGRERMESWFNRAMQLDPTFEEATRLMALYLQPAWHGTEPDALAFARSCVTNSQWKGRVPLTLVDAHHDLASMRKLTNSPSYWTQPQVWADVQQAYEAFFRENREAAEWRQNYARDAFLCGQYGVFLDQAKQFRGATNFVLFGGAAKFREMLAEASTKTGGL